MNLGEFPHYPIWNLNVWKMPDDEACYDQDISFTSHDSLAANGVADCVTDKMLGSLGFQCCDQYRCFQDGIGGSLIDCFVSLNYFPPDVTTTPVPSGGYDTLVGNKHNEVNSLTACLTSLNVIDPSYPSFLLPFSNAEYVDP